MLFTTTILATLVASAAAARDESTFAVLHHYGKGPLATCRVDPIVNPGTEAAHLHTIMGGSNFGMNSTGEDLLQSRCTTVLAKADKSAYWFPTLFFKDPKDGRFEKVDFFYSNVYYFFEATNDDLKAFPVGLRILSGDASLRSPPPGNGRLNLDPSKGPIQPAQITCPRPNFDPPSWPANSDGTMAGMQDPGNKGSGVGFPVRNCDGYASPMRMDLHLPSCYNPAAGLEDYKNNMRFPTDAGNGKVDCPKGWIHVPHLFYEVYWDTAKLHDRFKDLEGKESPFVWANGDATGYSIHGDFISGWDERALQQIIDSKCNAGHSGIEKCPGLIGGVNDPSDSCNIECPVRDNIEGKLSALPGRNQLSGWKYGGGSGGGDAGSGSGNGGVNNPGSGSGSSTTVKPPPAQEPTIAPPASTVKPNPPPVESPPADSPSPVQTSTKKLPGGDYAGNPKPLPTTTEAPAEPSPEPPKVGKTDTVWETETAWVTTTVYGKPGVPKPKPTPNPSGGQSAKAISGFKYAGCYRDGEKRVLDGEIRPNLGRISNTNCVTYCASKGFSVAGTEYGGQCYCGNGLAQVEKIAESECSMKCEGAGDQSCGGGWALSVYTKTGSVKKTSRRSVMHGHVHRRSGGGHRHI